MHIKECARVTGLCILFSVYIQVVTVVALSVFGLRDELKEIRKRLKAFVLIATFVVVIFGHSIYRNVYALASAALDTGGSNSRPARSWSTSFRLVDNTVHKNESGGF